MKSLSRQAFIALTVGLVGLPSAARAEFYSLEGRFQCLERGDKVCFDSSVAKLEPPFAAPAAAAPDSSDSPVPVAVSRPEPTTRSTLSPKAPPDPILAIAQRIERARPGPGDLDRLRHAADAEDGRAIELLAWCALKGIGTGRDPVEAYLLYGKAAVASVPRARQNQALVFETVLTSAERQHVLDLQARADR
jgi:hypothetical protein